MLRQAGIPHRNRGLGRDGDRESLAGNAKRPCPCRCLSYSADRKLDGMVRQELDGREYCGASVCVESGSVAVIYDREMKS